MEEYHFSYHLLASSFVVGCIREHGMVSHSLAVHSFLSNAMRTNAFRHRSNFTCLELARVIGGQRGSQHLELRARRENWDIFFMLEDHSNWPSSQQVQSLSAIKASPRFLPNVILEIIINIVTGLLVDKISANHPIFITSSVSAASSLLMALINPDWSYWYAAFWVVPLSPVEIDGQ